MTPGKMSRSEAAPDGDRPLRADARRNRARILEVAGAVFAERGTSVSTEEIARVAGVGIGTVFRHFPTKEALLEAVFTSHLRRLADEAEALAAADDPGRAFLAYFARVVEQSATKNSFAAALAAAGIDVSHTRGQVGVDLRRALEGLLTRAQRAAAVRDDIGAPEVLALLVGASRAVEQAGADLDVRARALGVILDGLRPRRS
ncbi:TetR/AcrR family transcriptional regulator [Actinacidiphila oryziradicis]|uniref:Helix-turn-helix transcriptional regulator n=1 Tax=Actinacidiphila oryziradicis TaxID=2571141 RepID=A0A4U0T723_9ACTN|nr:TetR/AcrR family transcriptional regulator [Actinacidiphila oryziradicis]TKA08785.1 helix-turn-helix transcriptional regulator [Actinacidiphila oryziradicis]